MLYLCIKVKQLYLQRCNLTGDPKLCPYKYYLNIEGIYFSRFYDDPKCDRVRSTPTKLDNHRLAPRYFFQTICIDFKNCLCVLGMKRVYEELVTCLMKSFVS